MKKIFIILVLFLGTASGVKAQTDLNRVRSGVEAAVYKALEEDAARKRKAAEKERRTQERKAQQQRQHEERFRQQMTNLNQTTAQDFMSGPSQGNRQEAVNTNAQQGFRATNYNDIENREIVKGPVATRKKASPNQEKTYTQKQWNNERDNFAWSGNDYTQGRYKPNSLSFTAEEYQKYEEKTTLQETADFVRVTHYEKLPNMSTEAFADYCSKKSQEVQRVSQANPDTKYDLVCSSTTNAEGEVVQNVFIEYMFPNNSETSVLTPRNDKMGDLDTVITEANEPLTSNTEDKIAKLDAYKEELEKMKREAEAQALFCDKMISNMNHSLNEQELYVENNLADLGMRTIPFDKAGPLGAWAKDKISNMKDQYFKERKEKEGIPDEPDNQVANIISEVREIPGIDDVAKHYMGLYSVALTNSPEIGKAIGNGAAYVNIFFDKREWKSKGDEARRNIDDIQRHIDMVEQASDKLKQSSPTF